MTLWWKSGWFAAAPHPDDEELLLYMDGELPKRAQARCRRHLEDCSGCRARLDRLSGAMAALYAYHQASAARMPSPPGRWYGFETRLRDRRDVQTVERTGGRRWRLAASLATAAAAIVWLFWNPTATVSANQILQNAQAAETRVTSQAAASVTYQRLRFTRRSSANGPVQSEEVEIWTDAKGERFYRRGQGPLWGEVVPVLLRNGLNEQRPLSAAAFRTWRESVRKSKDDVRMIRLADGSKVFALTAYCHGPFAPNDLTEATFLVRSDTWHAIGLTLRVQADQELVDYELREAAFSATGGPSLPPEMVPAEPRRGRTTIHAPQSVHSDVPSAPALPTALDELQVLHALHLLDACRGEQLNIARDSSRILVKGVVETEARRRELASALRFSPRVRLTLKSVEAENPAPVEPSSAPAMHLPSGSPLLSELLEQRFPGSSGEAADEAVRLADIVLTDAWALRRLAEWSAANLGIEPLPEALVAMVTDHSVRLKDEAGRLDAHLRPLLGEAEPAQPEPQADWIRGASHLFGAAQHLQELVRFLLVESSSQTADVPAALQRLTGARQRLAAAQAGFDRAFAVVVPPKQ